jgi:cation:H+ antiporter
MEPMFDWLLLAAGLGGAILGGDLFVRGAARISARAGISTAFLGATLGALATSFPELSVALVSALEGRPEISLGDVLGSNVVNISLVLAIGLCFSPVHAPRETLRLDYPVAMLVPVVLFLMAWDGQISRNDGFFLLGSFALWMAAAVRLSIRERHAANTESLQNGTGIPAALGGLALLGGAGQFIVTAAASIAGTLGISEFSVGATLVAFGTSTPELATLLIAKSRKHTALGLGTILGSNIVNGFLIAGVAASISPMEIKWAVVAVSLGAGLATTIVILPNREGWIGRWRGPILLACYAATTFLLAAIG